MKVIEGYKLLEDLYYHETHTWARVNPDGTVTVGIDDYAQKGTGGIVFIELPEVGDEVEQGGPLCVIEGHKWVGEAVSPVSGRIKEVNEELLDNPTLIHEDPYGEGWIAVIEPTNLEEELKKLYHGADPKTEEWLKQEAKKMK